MAKLVRKSSPAARLADERFSEAAVSDRGYPDGASFIGADEPHVGAVLAEAVANQQPLVIVYDDGKELIGVPEQGTLAFTVGAPRLSPRERLERSLAHPLRVRLLGVIGDREISPDQAAREMDLPLGDTAYHFKVLSNYGMIELVRTEPVRGAVRHYYRATDLARTSSWDEIASSLRTQE